MSKIVRLTTRCTRSERATAADLAEQLRHLPDELLWQLPGGLRRAISAATHGLYRHARPDTEEGLWPGGYTMLSRAQTALVWEAIRKLPPDQRPLQVRDAFMLMLLNLRQDTGEVMMSREDFAAKLGCAPRNVSTVMGTLERMGVVRRDRNRIDGVLTVTYVVNPDVAWNGSLDIRKVEAAKTGKAQLKLVPTGPTEPTGPVEPASSPEPDPAPAPQPRRGRGRRPAPAG